MSTVKNHRDKQKYIDAAHAAEQKYGLPRNLLVGVMGAESNFNPNATSPVGARGLMQFMPETAKAYGIDSLNPDQSIDAAGKYLASSYKQFGNWDDALRSYNMGVGGLKKVKAGKRSLPKETAEYTGRVYKHAGKDYSTEITPKQETTSYANNVEPYINPQQATTAVNQLQIPIINANFAGVSESNDTDSAEKEDKQPIKEAEEVKQQTNEYNFLKDYQEQFAQQQQQPIEIPTIDVEQTVNEVSQFVDNPVAQQGLRKPFKLQDERNLVQKDNIPTFKKQDKIRVLTEAEKEARRIAEIKARQGEIRQHTPQSTFSRVKEIGLNPLTAAGYAARNEDLPENFSKGARNPLDYAIDVINPVQYVEDTKNVLQGTARGDIGQVGEGLLGVVPMGLEAKNIYKGVKNIPININNLGNKYLPNAYKHNPWAFKADPKAYYRKIGDEGLDDLMDSGVLRSKPDGRFVQEQPYFSKGIPMDGGRAGKFSVPAMQKMKYPGKYMAETKGIPFNDVTGVTGQPINTIFKGTEGLNIYKEDWLQGYKQVEVPKTAQNFKSEINWEQWNKEIPNNPQLMQEYNAIEQTSKANGSWMKNPDGSPFKGTPEQFVQQNSENFKKAFSGKVNKQYHTTDKNFEVFDTTKSPSKGIFFTPDKEYSEKFTKIYKPSDEVSNIGEYYLNVNKPLNVDDPISHTTVSHYYNQRPFAAGNYDAIQGKEMDILGGKSDIDVTTVFSPNQIKSAIGNNGMFDMNNPNIYKSIAPIAGASYLATQGQNKQQGGTAEDNKWLQNWYANRVIPNKDIQDAYLEDKPIYLERLKNIPPVTKVDMIDNNPNKTGQYNDNTGELLLTPKAQPSVYTHEVNHYLNQFPSTMRTIHENIVEQNMYKKNDPRLGVNNEHYDYLRNPDEIHSRIQVLRKDAGFKPNEKVTEEKLLKYLQNYKGNDENILQIMNLTDEKGLLEMLNYMADNSKPNNKGYAQQGVIKDQEGQRKFTENEIAFLAELKNIPISSGGVYDYPKQEVIVPTKDGRITMKNINYSIKGTDEYGNTQIMHPNKEYKFKGKIIHEKPQIK